jgi:hypothetical protein
LGCKLLAQPHQFAGLLVIAHAIVQFSDSSKRSVGGLLSVNPIGCIQHDPEGGAHVFGSEFVWQIFEPLAGS